MKNTMKNTCLRLTLLTLFFYLPVFAQTAPPTTAALPKDAVKPDAKNEWKKDMIGGVSFTQSGFSNWVEGGTNSLALIGNVAGKFDHLSPNLKRSHNLQLSYGQIKQGDLEFRKATDVIYYLFQATRENGKKWKPTAAADFRTQFSQTFDYKVATKPVISALFAPAYFTQTIGFAYEPHAHFSQTIGIGAKQTVVRVANLRPAFGLKADQNLRFEAGATTLTKINREVAKNVTLKSQLGTFWSLAKPVGNYKDGKAKKWGPDVRWDNLIQMKVNDYLNVNFELSTLFDTDQSAKLQMRELLGVGLSYKFY